MCTYLWHQWENSVSYLFLNYKKSTLHHMKSQKNKSSHQGIKSIYFDPIKVVATKVLVSWLETNWKLLHFLKQLWFWSNFSQKPRNLLRNLASKGKQHGWRSGMSQKETLKTSSAKKDIKSSSGSKPTFSCETLKAIQPTTIDHVTSSNTIMLVMMTNSIQLKEQIAQMVKQNEVLTKTMNKNNAQIGLLVGKIKRM